MIIIRGRSDDAIEIAGLFSEVIECTAKKAVVEFEDRTKIKFIFHDKTGYWELKVLRKGDDFVRLVPPNKVTKSSEVHIENYEYTIA